MNRKGRILPPPPGKIGLNLYVLGFLRVCKSGGGGVFDTPRKFDPDKLG